MIECKRGRCDLCGTKGPVFTYGKAWYCNTCCERMDIYYVKKLRLRYARRLES